jgi:YVTN family beta-propeller protein
LATALLSTAGAVLPAASAHAAGPAQLAYFTDVRNNALVTYDLSSNSVVGSVPVGRIPTVLAVSPDGSQVWVGHMLDGTVSVVDTATDTVTATIPVGRVANAIAFSPDGSRVYVADNRGGHTGIDVFDPATRTVTATIPTAGTVSQLAPTPDGKHLYAGMGNLLVIDTATDTITASIPTADNRSIGGLAISPDGTRVFATNINTGTLSVVDVAAGQLAATVPISQYDGSVALSTDGADAYVIGGNALTVVDTASDTVVTSIPIPGGPDKVVADPDGTHLHVATGRGDMVVVDTRTNTVLSSNATGRYAYDMVLAPAAKPAITALAPDHGSLDGGTTVTITGSHFTGATAVDFGGTAATFTVDSDTQITATVPAASAIGAVGVTVTTPQGTSAAVNYGYDYPFSGFQAPVDNPPAVNAIKAGRAVPIQFGLGGDRGLDVLAAGQPTVQQTDCITGAAIGSPVPAQTAGGSTLQYDPAGATYTYVWKTDKAWNSTCQTFTLGLNDGTTHTALFQLR